MKSRILLLKIVVAAAAAFYAIHVIAAGHDRSFNVYDNMFYRGKPDTTRNGLLVSNILYENKIWPNDENYGKLPDKKAFETLVRQHISNPGPLVIDIEKLPLKGSPEIAHQHMEVLATLAVWAHEAAPGKTIGFYGTNTLSKVASADFGYAHELARHVDAFFPPLYTFDDNRLAWQQHAEDVVAEAHRLDPDKPVYFYLWPQYHDGTAKQFQYVDASYWKFQLETAHRLGDGAVLWSPSRYDWDDTTGWWAATQEFVRTIRTKP
jgi:hypothetical protein